MSSSRISSSLSRPTSNGAGFTTSSSSTTVSAPLSSSSSSSSSSSGTSSSSSNQSMSSSSLVSSLPTNVGPVLDQSSTSTSSSSSKITIALATAIPIAVFLVLIGLLFLFLLRRHKRHIVDVERSMPDPFDASLFPLPPPPPPPAVQKKKEAAEARRQAKKRKEKPEAQFIQPLPPVSFPNPPPPTPRLSLRRNKRRKRVANPDLDPIEKHLAHFKFPREPAVQNPSPVSNTPSSSLHPRSPITIDDDDQAPLNPRASTSVPPTPRPPTPVSPTPTLRVSRRFSRWSRASTLNGDAASIASTLVGSIPPLPDIRSLFRAPPLPPLPNVLKRSRPLPIPPPMPPPTSPLPPVPDSSLMGIASASTGASGSGSGSKSQPEPSGSGMMLDSAGTVLSCYGEESGIFTLMQIEKTRQMEIEMIEMAEARKVAEEEWARMRREKEKEGFFDDEDEEEEEEGREDGESMRKDGDEGDTSSEEEEWKEEEAKAEAAAAAALEEKIRHQQEYDAERVGPPGGNGPGVGGIYRHEDAGLLMLNELPPAYRDWRRHTISTPPSAHPYATAGPEMFSEF